MQATLPEAFPAAIPHPQAPSPIIGQATLLAGALIGLLSGPVEQVALDRIDRDPGNPRRPETPEALASLAASIKAIGILQPVLVTDRAATGRYDLLDGHRRCSAAAIAGLTSVPAIVIHKRLTSAERIQVALVSTLQRADLKPCSEEAVGYETLIARHAFTLAQLGEVTGRPVHELSRTLSLRKLPEDIQALIDSGARSKTAGVELAKVKDEATRRTLCERFRLTPLTCEQMAAARQARRKPAASAARPLKQVTLRLGEQGATIIVKCPPDLPQLDTEQILFALEYGAREIKKAHRKDVPAVELASHFQKLRAALPKTPAGTPASATANGHAAAPPGPAANAG